MARIFNAVYKPTTFDELWKPLAYYNEAYQKESDELQKRMDFNALLEALNTPLDQEAYAEVKQQQDTLKNIAEGMSDPNIGLRAVNQQAMDAFRNQSRMEALATLYNQRQALIQEQRKANQNGNLLFDVDYTNVPVTELGKYNMNYHTMNPDYIYNTSANFFKQFADLTENGTPEEKRAYGMLRQITGGEYSLGDIQDYINGALPDGEKKDRLNRLVDEFKGRINIEQYNPLNQDGTQKEGNLWTNDAYNTAISAMNAGMYSAASQKKYSYVHLPQSSSGSSQPKPESLESLYKKGVTADPNNPNRKFYFNGNGQLISAIDFITDDQGNPVGIKTEGGLPKNYVEEQEQQVDTTLIDSKNIGIYSFKFDTEGMKAKTEFPSDKEDFVQNIPSSAKKAELSVGEDGNVSAAFPLGQDNKLLYYEDDDKGASEKRTKDINNQINTALTRINNAIQEYNALNSTSYRTITINDVEVYIDKKQGRNNGTVYIKIKPNVATPIQSQEGQGAQTQSVTPQPNDTVIINQATLDSIVG